MERVGERNMADAMAQPFFFPGGEHGVLLIHGFTGSSGHMRLLGEHLHAVGFTVRGINLPGHGSRLEDMGKYTWKDWLQASKMAVAEMQEQCRYVSVAGLSMGGVLTLLVAEQMEITAAAPISAPMGVQNRFLPFARLGSLVMKTTYWQRDREREQLLDQRYDYGYAGFPTKSAADLYHLMRLARRNLYAVTCPVLVVQSRKDETITADSAEVIVNGVSSQRRGVMPLVLFWNFSGHSAYHSLKTSAFKISEWMAATPLTKLEPYTARFAMCTRRSRIMRISSAPCAWRRFSSRASWRSISRITRSSSGETSLSSEASQHSSASRMTVWFV